MFFPGCQLHVKLAISSLKTELPHTRQFDAGLVQVTWIISQVNMISIKPSQETYGPWTIYKIFKSSALPISYTSVSDMKYVLMKTGCNLRENVVKNTGN